MVQMPSKKEEVVSIFVCKINGKEEEGEKIV